MIKREITVSLIFDESHTEEQMEDTIAVLRSAVENMEERHLHHLDITEDEIYRDNNYECDCEFCLTEKSRTLN